MESVDKFGLNFGLVIAYMIPGFVATYAVAPYVKAIDALLGGPERVPGPNSIVPAILIAVALGIIINAISAVLLRPLIHLTRVKKASGAGRKPTTEERLRYDRLMDSSFRYHQFYANMLIAVLLLGPLWLLSPLDDHIVRNASLPLVVIALFLTARLALRHFYDGVRAICAEEPPAQLSEQPAPTG